MKAKRVSRYREYKDWLGGFYGANAFDLDEVNEQLGKPAYGNSVSSPTLNYPFLWGCAKIPVMYLET